MCCDDDFSFCFLTGMRTRAFSSCACHIRRWPGMAERQSSAVQKGNPSSRHRSWSWSTAVLGTQLSLVGLGSVLRCPLAPRRRRCIRTLYDPVLVRTSSVDAVRGTSSVCRPCRSRKTADSRPSAAGSDAEWLSTTMTVDVVW